MILEEEEEGKNDYPVSHVAVLRTTRESIPIRVRISFVSLGQARFNF